MNAGSRAGTSRRLQLTAGFIFAMSALLAALLIPVVQQKSLEKSLWRAIRMYRVGYASHIELAQFTDFDWEYVHIFPPYTPKGSIDAELGFDWAYIVRTSIASSDSVTLLVFVADGRVVRWIEMPRSSMDFTAAAAESPFTPASARFFLPDETRNLLGILR